MAKMLSSGTGCSKRSSTQRILITTQVFYNAAVIPDLIHRNSISSAQSYSGAMSLVFKDVTPDMVTVSFRRLCRRLEIHDFRFHDLRHTAASWLRMSGADIHTVAQLLGHKDLRMAARYQHLSPAFLGEAVNRLDGVFGIPGSEPALDGPHRRYQDATRILSEPVS